MKRIEKDIHGVFILNKPVGLSSNQALQKVKRLFQAKKAGHTGSLDVLASGLLPICVGEATKFSQFLLDANKAYLTTARLGIRTTTCDAEGEIVEEKPWQSINDAQLSAVLSQFRGDISQIPSMYSALKHQGKPLYELARQGIEIERPARHIRIDELTLLKREGRDLELRVACSKGTYIRNLVDDIGQALNCGAYVAALHRITAGHFTANQMCTLEQLEAMDEAQRLQTLLPLDTLVQDLTAMQLNSQEVIDIYHGKIVSTQQAEGIYSLYADNNLIGVGEVLDKQLKSKRLLTKL